MATKLIRVTTDCIDILHKYCPTGSLSDGIRDMDRRIRDSEMSVPMTLPNTAGSGYEGTTSAWYPVSPELVDGQTKGYWKRLRGEIDAAIKVYTGSF
jgi:hypothetical protein